MLDLRALVDALHGLPALRLAVLFGSQASGRPRPDSDVDLAVILDPDTDQTRSELELAASAALSAPLDLVFLSEAPPQLRFEVAGGRLLVGAREDFVDFKTRAMLDWWEERPLLDRIHRAAAARLRAKVEASHGQG